MSDETTPQTTESGTDWSQPQTHLETVLKAGQENRVEAGEVIATFLNSEVFFLSREKVDESSPQVQPMLLQNADNQPVVALFTHPARIPGAYIEEAPFAVRVLGASVVDHLSGAGLVLNPGHDLGFEIPAEGVAQIRRDFRPDAAAEQATDS
ncbi:hypothetical protein NCCP1664_08570 [Zafaria cholistanensis]|uniref:SseB protein N-terminal domain-containing protein n=1 Tax=Zafaria cholistanensis TaxID=1682741 RepID=A0A5A7NNI9_9MICC|nr:SseB family protein [Zafaria cholistanensis]GER22360.1 hypothetical protein NCCP1664_08570 [Zafaria cholistanensis]